MAKAIPSSLHVLAPGLLGPVIGADQLMPPVAVPHLERCLARAELSRIPGWDLESTLCWLFGVERGSGDLPLAALRRLGRGNSADQRFWLQAEPVCLRPDQSRLLLFDTLDFQVSPEELLSLGMLFRNHFQDRDWLIETDDPGCWFLSPGRPPGIRSRHLGEVFGRNMDLFLPSGEEAMAWHSLLNEIQMLFFDAQVNRVREAQGKMPVSGLWFSGGGVLPESVSSRCDRIYGGDDLARGLARHAAIPVTALPGRPAELSANGGNGLIIYPALQRPVWRGDPYDWRDALLTFDNWMAETTRHAAAHGIGELQLYSCDGRVFHMRSADRYRFWRRPRAVTGWFE